MRKDNLGDRMKSYENITRAYLPNRMPVIIRLDGCHFHTFTKGFNKPFDGILMRAMWQTAMELCKKIEGVKLAYTQSDEISLLITNNDTWETQPWFGNNILKMTSVAASIATLAFNRAFWREVNILNNDYLNTEDTKRLNTYCYAVEKGATFDSRVFVLPEDEVCNYFIWRQQDAIRNSIQAVGQAYFSHKELMNKSCEDIKQMLVEKNIKWEAYSKAHQRGICVIKQSTPIMTTVYFGTNKTETTYRNKWIIDEVIPLFWENREYIDKLLGDKYEK